MADAPDAVLDTSQARSVAGQVTHVGTLAPFMLCQVFKPSHILPTMTVEEAGEVEREEAMEREERQRRQEDKERARRVRQGMGEGRRGKEEARQVGEGRG